MNNKYRSYNSDEIKDLDKIYRLNLINSITGIKPANMIGTRSESGQENLAIFSSVVHLGSKPPLIGMVSRPRGDVARHTIENIESTRYYTINSVNQAQIKSAHYTSAKWSKDESEFKECGFTPHYEKRFYAPFVQESPLKIGLSLQQIIPININGTILIIGEVERILVNKDSIADDGQINLQKLGTVGISGLNSYYRLEHITTYPYARTKDYKSELSQ